MTQASRRCVAQDMAFSVAASAIAPFRRHLVLLVVAASAMGCAAAIPAASPRVSEALSAPSPSRAPAMPSSGAIEAIENRFILVRLDDGTYRHVASETGTEMQVGYRVRIEKSRVLRADDRRFYTDEKGIRYDDRGFRYDSRGFRYDARGNRD